MASLHKWLGAVEAFQVRIIGSEIPRGPRRLSVEERSYTVGHIIEELNELEAAHDVYEEADALIDAIYIALGGLFKMGLAPGELFQEVHAANMRKVPASTTRSTKDAGKPPGWVGPDMEAAVERALNWGVQLEPAAIPELFQRVMAKTAQRGKSYNTSSAADVQIPDYFPFGHSSYVSVLWLKALRLVATVGRNLQFPSLPDCAEHVVDLTAYASFYFTSIMKEARKDPELLQAVEDKLAQ